MKVKTYLRVARDSRRGTTKVVASAKPNLAPLTKGSARSEVYLPTIHFAIELDIAPDAFAQAEKVIGTLAIPAAAITVAAEVISHED